MMGHDPESASDFTITHGVLGQCFIVRGKLGPILGVALDPERAAAIVTSEVARQTRFFETARERGIFF